MDPKRLSTLLVTLLVMAIAEINPVISGDVTCEEDSNCSAEQYCYTLSKICVDYTQCSRYNRQDGESYARGPAQCGPCLPGYYAELLTRNVPEALCKKSTELEDLPAPLEKHYQWWIYVLAVSILFMVVLSVPGYLLRKRITGHRAEIWLKRIGGWSFAPTAPPPDNGIYHLRPLYNDEQPPVYSSVINNNGKIKDRNLLVNAVPFSSPDWVQHDESYDAPDAVASASVTTTLEIQDEDTTPSTWAPEDVVVTLPARPFFFEEQRENHVNNVLDQDDCIGTASEPTDDGNPGPNPTNNRQSGESYRGPNVQINQMITLNMVNSHN